MSDNTPTQSTPTLLPVLSQFVSYENGDVTLKIKATTLINTFVFLTTANPSLANAMPYAESIQALADLTRVAQDELTKEMEAQEAEVATEPETLPTEPDAKPVIKAEVVEPTV